MAQALSDIEPKDTTAREFFFYAGQKRPSTLSEILVDILGRHILIPEEDRATELAKDLSAKFNVEVQVVDTNDMYYSDDSLLKTAKDGVYFLSREDLERTAQETKHLIRYVKLKYELANASRINKATQKSLGLAETIAQIKDTYKNTHAGKEPSLRKIAAILNEEKILSPGGKTDWAANSVKRIVEMTEHQKIAR